MTVLDAAQALDAFAEVLGAETDERKREALLSRVKFKAAQLAPAEAFERKTIGRSAADLLTSTPETPAWLVPGVIAKGWTVKVAAREKTGKGTHIAYLLGKLERGEATVYGDATAPVSALIYTEEPEDSIREKIDAAKLSKAWVVFGWELAGKSWPEKVAELVSMAVDGGHGLVFVDNISRATGAEDEAGVELARQVEVLSEAAKAEGLAVFIDHHHKKGAGRLEDKSRGGTALAGAVENNIEMERVGGWESRVRKISSRGRTRSTIWVQTIELTEDGTEYRSVADTTQPQTAKERRRLEALDGAGDAGVTAAEFAELIEASDDTARRELEEFLSKGWAIKDDAAYPARWISSGEGLTAGGLEL